MSDPIAAPVPFSRIAAPRKLVVCCDGTWNEPYQIGNPTNVVKMVRAILPKDANEAAQLVYYHAGVGTGNIVDRFMGGTMGVGLASNVQTAYEFLATNYVNGDKIYLFGFSRGAYTARAVAGLIGKVGGLLLKQDMDLFPYVYDIYRNREHRDALGTKDPAKIKATVRAVHSERKLGKNFDRLIDALSRANSAPIFFIGVWDTVGSLGVPGRGLRWIGQSKYNFHDTGLSPRIRFAYHAIGIDEKRSTFVPTLWTRPKVRHDPGDVVPVLEQVWFAGVHSSVGGGYEDRGLSDIAFLWMVDKAMTARGLHDARQSWLPLAFDEEYLAGNIQPTMGRLKDSGRFVFWKVLGLRDRTMMATPPPNATTGEEQETCEAVHWSARVRLECDEKGRFEPFPYRPRNLMAALGKDTTVVTEPSELERKYLPWFHTST
jgi:uncharacterized protein (DUF2235 family)